MAEGKDVQRSRGLSVPGMHGLACALGRHRLDPFLQPWTMQIWDWPTLVSPLKTTYSPLHFPAWTFQFLLNKELKFNPGLPNQTWNLRRASTPFLLSSVSWEVFWILTSTAAPNKNEVNFVQSAEVQRLSSMQVFCEAEQQEVRN